MINNPKSLDRILTTHVGSLIRPPALVDLLRLKAEGKAVDSAEFAACYHDSVAEVVRRQAEIGVDIVSDGEFGKSISWSRYILERLSGFERRASDQNSVMPASVHGRDRREFAELRRVRQIAGRCGYERLGRHRTNRLHGHRFPQA
jgi:5-methyltetrahydropteroyltriglutamate--homocysteine methyltransferase